MAPHSKLARLLTQKAAQDEKVIRILMDNPDAPYEAIGFNAQQAVEKLLKAVLAFSGVPFRRIHDILELVDLLQDNAIPFPEHLDEVRRLSPFAVEHEFRLLVLR